MSDIKDANLSAIRGFQRAFLAYGTQLANANKKMQALTHTVGSSWKDPDYVIMQRIVDEIAMQLHSVDDLDKTMDGFLELKAKVVAEHVGGQH